MLITLEEFFMLCLIRFNQFIVGSNFFLQPFEYLQKIYATANCPLTLINIVLPIPHLYVMHYRTTSTSAKEEIETVVMHQDEVLVEVGKLFYS